MTRNFTISYATDVETGLKLKDYAKEAGLSLSAFSCLAVKAVINALPCSFFKETAPDYLALVLKDVISKGYKLGDMVLES